MTRPATTTAHSASTRVILNAARVRVPIATDTATISERFDAVAPRRGFEPLFGRWFVGLRLPYEGNELCSAHIVSRPAATP
jgi:hypothetical protein